MPRHVAVVRCRVILSGHLITPPQSIDYGGEAPEAVRHTQYYQSLFHADKTLVLKICDPIIQKIKNITKVLSDDEAILQVSVRVFIPANSWVNASGFALRATTQSVVAHDSRGYTATSQHCFFLFLFKLFMPKSDAITMS